jgi:hypothetical protein
MERPKSVSRARFVGHTPTVNRSPGLSRAKMTDAGSERNGALDRQTVKSGLQLSSIIAMWRWQNPYLTLACLLQRQVPLR